METRLWDALRESGIKGYLTLACLTDEERDRLVGPELVEVARNEADIGKVLLEQKLAGIERDGLPEPPPPSKPVVVAVPTVASVTGRKPFQLPAKSPMVSARSSTEEITHVDKKAKVGKAATEKIRLWIFFGYTSSSLVSTVSCGLIVSRTILLETRRSQSCLRIGVGARTSRTT